MLQSKLVIMNGPHRKTVVAAVIAHVNIARLEDEVPYAVRVVSEERTRPVAAVVADTAEIVAPMVACSGQENTITIMSGNETAEHTILLCQPDGRIVIKFLPFLRSGRAPTIAPIGCSSIVLGQQGGQAISEAIVAKAGIVAIFSEVRIIK